MTKPVSPLELGHLSQTDSLETWRDANELERIKRARTDAFILRRRRKKKLRNITNKRTKNAVIAANQKANKDARKLIVVAKRRTAGRLERNATSRRALIATKKSSLLLDGLAPKSRDNWVSIPKRLQSRIHTTIEAKDFCFLTNPIDTLNVLAEIASAETKCISARINFLDRRCKDIGPWLVLSSMRPNMAPIFSGGTISSSMSKVIGAVGLHEPLGFTFESPNGGEQDVWAFPVRTRRAAGSSTSKTQHLDPQAAERVGGDLCEAINAWLGACVEQELTTEGMRSVKKIVGESLDNAERHSRREYQNDGDWSITGFMAKRVGPNGPLFRCQLSFLSVGASISDSIQDAHASIQAEMNTYVMSHRNAEPNHAFADDHLRTIFALQDTVTRDHDALSEGRGGTGFRDIICLFGDLAGSHEAENDATLSLVSGRTCLHIDFSQSEVVRPLPGQKFNIWLNQENNREIPPEPNRVKELEKRFCGTLITMGFTLDPDYLESTVDD